MFETLSILPIAFWAVVAVLIWGTIQGIRHLRDGSGLPMLAVLGTVTVWYVGDAFYNGYAPNYTNLFTADVLRGAWWQAAWFLLVFIVVTPWIHQWLNRRYLRQGSGVLQLFKYGIGHPAFQKQLNRAFYGCAAVWSVLTIVAVIRLRSQIIYFFFPFLGYEVGPWSHGRIGAGFDFLSVVAGNLQLLVAGIFGVVAALSTSHRVRWLAVFGCALTWPYYLFGWARNMMLAITIPGVLSYVFLRMRGGLGKRFIVLGVCFMVVNAWMGFVIANRSHISLVAAFRENGFHFSRDEDVHHEGLNMYEELCWMNTFIQAGTYEPDWGKEYFAELVNPIPRRFWPGKPLIGIDYAIARGQGGNESAGSVGVYATISTGMIGQGVVNFGRFLGPPFAALLMGFWVVLLARLDLRIHEFGRLPLYALGLILTFNLGRDITFLVLYPFVFGAALVWWIERHRASRPVRSPQKAVPRARLAPAMSSRHMTPVKTSMHPVPWRRRLASVRTVWIWPG